MADEEFTWIKGSKERYRRKWFEEHSEELRMRKEHNWNRGILGLWDYKIVELCNYGIVKL